MVAVQGLRTVRSGGPSGMRSEHLHPILADKVRLDLLVDKAPRGGRYFGGGAGPAHGKGRRTIRDAFRTPT